MATTIDGRIDQQKGHGDAEVVFGGRCCCLLTAACETTGAPAHFALPTGPTVISVPPPPARPYSPMVFTTIQVGEVVRRRVADPPECVEYPGWPCQYFRLTVPSSGRLEIVLAYSGNTPPSQGVDLSVRESEGRSDLWAQFSTANETRVIAPVDEGRTYYITMWYTFPGLEFELRSSFQ